MLPRGSTVSNVMSFREADPLSRKNATRLFFDIDDTLTWNGQLPEVAASALYKAHAAGLSLVAVTGRSFSWAEMILRLFPLDAAVAETGACALFRVAGQHVDVIHTESDAAVRKQNAQRRDRACDVVMSRIRTARLALDNPGRLYDSAFDLVESGPPVPEEDAREIRTILEEHGLVTAQSSVHINAWIGSFDKSTMVDRLLRERFSTSLDAAASTLVYVGDSENDGPLFARAHLSVGVANVAPHLPRLAVKGQQPRFIVDGRGGHGFAQVVSLLLEDR